jgi:hypothetical protein
MRRSLLLIATLAITGALVLPGTPPVGAALSTYLSQAGPAVLHEPPPDAPQLQNTGIWHAKPTMVCDTSAYRAGEFLYQGCVYDDQGAQLVPTNWPEHSFLFAYTYPTNPVYRANAADLVEVRIQPLATATAFRITFNTMLDPDLVGTTIALGNSATPHEAPHGANTVMPAQTFVTVHGSTADAVDAATGQPLAQQPTVSVDLTRRQIQVLVPHTIFNPTGKTERIAAAAGLWDSANDRFLVPSAVADATHPGGALTGGLARSAYFDVAFRYNEPFDSPWRNDLQKTALASGNISRFYADVDFTKLAAGVNDDMSDQPDGVPTWGFMDRIYASHFESAQGRRVPGHDPGGPPTGAFTQQYGLTTQGDGTVSGQFGWVCRDGCVPDLSGQLQRYLAYVPKTAAPADGYASLLWTPGYAQSANDQVNDPGYEELLPAGNKDLFRQVANNPLAPTVVIDVDGRGNDTWYYGQGGASVFEALADARRVFHLDPSRTVMGGFSSGGYGANKLSLQFPDVFSKAFICDGLNKAPSFPGINGIADVLPVDTVTQHEPGSTLTPLLPSRRNQPVMEWSGLWDDYVPVDIPRARADVYKQGTYDYDFVTFTGLSAEHVVMCANGMWSLLTKWLGDMRGVGDPFHVTYVRNPAMDDPAATMVGDHAYWLSDIQTRSPDPTQVGTIDVVSHGFGLVDAPAAAVESSTGVVTGTTIPLNTYVSEQRPGTAPVSAPVENSLTITATNVGTVTVDPAQAHVTCDAALHVTTDGPLTVHLIGCGDHAFG